MPETVLKPPALSAGDTIGIAAPGSSIGREPLLAGVAELERLGYRARYREDIFSEDTFFAGSHERRAEEFLEMLEDPEVRAVFCARGGCGCNYVAARLAARPLPAPKIVMGYSDVTTLLAALWQRAGWVTFHGPMVTVDFAKGPEHYDSASLSRALAGAGGAWEAGRATRVLRPGAAEGRLLGGCLPMLAATLGTPREVDWQDAIVFLEDVAAKPYQIDRMLFQLREAGKFRGVRGIVFGEMKDCLQHPEQGYRLEDVVLRALRGLEAPIAFGFRSGHTTRGNICLPMGVRARLAEDRLEILEDAVTGSQ